MQQNNTKSSIILIGFMGSGKTTFGKELAKHLNYEFVDSDAEIEKNEGTPISEIFKTKGEEYFRKLESNYLKTVRLNSVVFATGGGMPFYKDNLDILKEKGIVIYLNVPFSELCKRLKEDDGNRPLIQRKEENKIEEQKLLTLFAKREGGYKKADIEIEADQDVVELIERVKKLNR